MNPFDDRAMELGAQHLAMSDALYRPQRDMHAAATATLEQARNAVDDIIAELALFESKLEPSEEVRIVVIGGPAGTTVFLEGITPLSHDRILFHGKDGEGCRVTVMQHVSQLNLMLKAVKVGKETARRIGFHSPADDD